VVGTAAQIGLCRQRHYAENRSEQAKSGCRKWSFATELPIRNMSVRHPIADMRADIAGRRFGPILLKNSPVETVKAH